MARCIFSVLNLKDDWNQIININYHNDCIRELVFWKLNIFDFKPTSLLEKSYNFDIFTDASDSGAAGFIQNTTFVMHKSWSEVEAVKSSTWRELKAIELSLLSFLHVLRNSTITFYTDNQNVAGIVLKGSKIYELQMIALSIFNTCMRNEIDIHAVWIPRIEIQRADFLSRIIDIDDWRTTVDFFQFLDSLWGPHTVDRFAHMNNTKLPSFNSLYWNPGSIGVDAFTSDWSDENNWLVPSVSMVSRVINHLIKSNSVGTLVVPKWPSSPFLATVIDFGDRQIK